MVKGGGHAAGGHEALPLPVLYNIIYHIMIYALLAAVRGLMGQRCHRRRAAHTLCYVILYRVRPEKSAARKWSDVVGYYIVLYYII